MYGLRSSDRRSRKGLTGALDHLGTDAQNSPVCGNGGQVSTSIGGFRLREFAQRHCPVQYPVALYKRQIRGDDNLLCSQQFADTCSGFFIKQPCQDGT